MPVSARIMLPSPMSMPRAYVARPQPIIYEPLPPGISHLLADPLPLRASPVGSPAASSGASYLPWVYGRCTIAPLPWDAEGLVWLLADHAIHSVHAVSYDGADVGGWQMEHVADADGHMQAVLRLSAALGGTPAVVLSGRVGGDSGVLLEHPSEIAADLLRQCGWLPDYGSFDELLLAWPELRVGGILAEAEPLREAVGRMVALCGADWSAVPLRCWMKGSGFGLRPLGVVEIDTGVAHSDHTSLATTARVSYAYDWAARGFSASCDVIADVDDHMVGLTTTLHYPWVARAEDAEALARAAMEILARPKWQMDLSLSVAHGARLLPGDRIDLTHPWLPSGVATVTQVVRSEGVVRLAVERPAGSAPAVRIVGGVPPPEPTPNTLLWVWDSESCAWRPAYETLNTPLHVRLGTIGGDRPRRILVAVPSAHDRVDWEATWRQWDAAEGEGEDLSSTLSYPSLIGPIPYVYKHYTAIIVMPRQDVNFDEAFFGTLSIKTGSEVALIDFQDGS